MNWDTIWVPGVSLLRAWQKNSEINSHTKGKTLCDGVEKVAGKKRWATCSPSNTLDVYFSETKRPIRKSKLPDTEKTTCHSGLNVHITQGLECHCLRDLGGTHTRPLNVCMPREGGDGPRNPCHFLVGQRPGTLVEGRGGVAID